MHKLLENAIPLGPEKAGTKSSTPLETTAARRQSMDPLDLTKPGAAFASVENVRCPHHFALPIQYFCLDCKDGEGCFCSECALTRHATCDVRTLEEAYTTVLNNVIRKWASQFTTRADGLELTFAQQLEDKREEWTMKLQEAQGVLNRMCEDVTTTVRELETSLVRWLNQSHRSFAQEHEKIREHVENTLESYAKNADMLRQQRRLPAARMLLFYHENHVMLRELLLGTTPRDSERMISQATRHLGVRLDNINATAVEYSKLIRQLERSIRHAEGYHEGRDQTDDEQHYGNDHHGLRGELALNSELKRQTVVFVQVRPPLSVGVFDVDDLRVVFVLILITVCDLVRQLPLRQVTAVVWKVSPVVLIWSY
ncbi:hypothetical protein, conserved [Babesia bigemina]|uniref:B box-type domain-containing protein n=1 Tax=Babesia bigemina TaxID=5866 RepID=A0A061D7L1_BABBI|nr:hypothetical protein, conserved [Babesia bigemina]CDR95977.1 hypothetical protein, conserved [Babesia bigemina]|eukprot:XP_012768163.1 hypothetical protein, conserved [Babesia bigemina]